MPPRLEATTPPKKTSSIQHYATPPLGDDISKGACGIAFISADRPCKAVTSRGLHILKCMASRGAQNLDGTGDGAGVLFYGYQKDYFRSKFQQVGVQVPDGVTDGKLIFANFFLTQNASEEEADLLAQQKLISDALKKYDLELVGWRDIETNADAAQLSEYARKVQPAFKQAMIVPKDRSKSAYDIEQCCIKASREIEEQVTEQGNTIDDLHVVSLSLEHIIFKGLLRADQVASFYPDVNHIVAQGVGDHSRLATNTNPSWSRAQPCRRLWHNGEFNSILSNVLERQMFSGKKVDISCSDTQLFEQRIEELLAQGVPITEALYRLMQPSPSLSTDPISDLAKACLLAFEAMEKGYNGPADVIALGYDSMQKPVVTCAIDRGGLRPAQHAEVVVADKEGKPITLQYFGSEMPFVDKGDRDLSSSDMYAQVKSCKLIGAGEVVKIDLASGKVIKGAEVLEEVANHSKVTKELLEPLPTGAVSDEEVSGGSGVIKNMLIKKLMAYGWDKSSLDKVTDMLANGKQSIAAMGRDIPDAAFQDFVRIYDFFTQSYTQVTAPVLDFIREAVLCSLRQAIGANMQVAPELARFESESPILTQSQYEQRKALDESKYTRIDVDATMPLPGKEKFDPEALLSAIAEDVCGKVKAANKEGKSAIINISDIKMKLTTRAGVAARMIIPDVYVVSMVHNALCKAKTEDGKSLRQLSSIVCESHQVHEPHGMALLLAAGANEICPSMAYELADAMGLGKNKQSLVEAFVKAVKKNMGKVGYTHLSSYIGSLASTFLSEGLYLKDGPHARIFEGLGSVYGGFDMNVIFSKLVHQHEMAASYSGPSIKNKGEKDSAAGGEQHGFGSEYVSARHDMLRKANGPSKRTYVEQLAECKKGKKPTVGIDGQELKDGKYSKEFIDSYQSDAAILFMDHWRNENTRNPITLRDASDIKSFGKPIPLEEVEPLSSIIRRFKGGAMSYGSMTKEAHTILGEAMRAVGARANAGEGGPSDAIENQQWASGRFHTGAHVYYMIGEGGELEIKVIQGAKPGEGGELPPQKVTEEIAAVRGTYPGFCLKTQDGKEMWYGGLVSPPPHHDIYSIEDLKELIYDLGGDAILNVSVEKQDDAIRISVKLGSHPSIGDIAAGVSKLLAELGVKGNISVSGKEGGTGASPWSSVMHAGMSAPAGVAAVDKSLMDKGLRGAVTVTSGGAIRTPWHVLYDIIMGADFPEIGSQELIDMGCVMAKKCNKAAQYDDMGNIVKDGGCPVYLTNTGEKFQDSGQALDVHRGLMNLAYGVRVLMSRLGIKNLDDVRGRRDLIEVHPERFHALAAMRDEIIEQLGKEEGQRIFDGLMSKFDFSHMAGESSLVHNPAVKISNEALEEKMAANVARTRTKKGSALWPQIETELTNSGNKKVCVRVEDASIEDHALGGFIALQLEKRFKPELNHAQRQQYTVLAQKDSNDTRIAVQEDHVTMVIGSDQQPASVSHAFGHKNVHGQCLKLIGRAHDYVGGSMTGGKLVLSRPQGYEDSAVAGNTCLYGARGGKAFFKGDVGSRAAVRNSGATVVFGRSAGFGLGGYMTRGSVLVLQGHNIGPCAFNGMGGGVAIVRGEPNAINNKLDHRYVNLQTKAEDREPYLEAIKSLIQEYASDTDDKVATQILSDWEREKDSFQVVLPKSMCALKDALSQRENVGLNQSAVTAFKKFERSIKQADNPLTVFEQVWFDQVRALMPMHHAAGVAAGSSLEF